MSERSYLTGDIRVLQGTTKSVNSIRCIILWGKYVPRKVKQKGNVN